MSERTMSGVQKAILPGMLAGILLLICLTSLITTPSEVLAFNPIATDAPIPEISDAQNDYRISLPLLSHQPALPQAPTLAPQPTEVKKPAKPEKASQNDQNRSESSSGCSVSERFPDSVRQWCGLIDKHARENGLDANLVAAVILQESGGNPRATSSSGAVGLMQVMPRDGAAAGFVCANGPCFSSRPSMSQLYDPDFNIQYGTRMLAGLVNKRGSTREALRAYGPSNMGYYYADKILGIYRTNK
jgi:hypothetical protein